MTEHPYAELLQQAMEGCEQYACLIPKLPPSAPGCAVRAVLLKDDSCEACSDAQTLLGATPYVQLDGVSDRGLQLQMQAAEQSGQVRIPRLLLVDCRDNVVGELAL